MAVPKKKQSHARSSRRRHANYTTAARKWQPAVEVCPTQSCGNLKLRHQACDKCGFYRGVSVFMDAETKKENNERLNKALIKKVQIDNRELVERIKNKDQKVASIKKAFAERPKVSMDRRGNDKKHWSQQIVARKRNVKADRRKLVLRQRNTEKRLSELQAPAAA